MQIISTGGAVENMSGRISNISQKMSRSAVLNFLTSSDPHWITTGSRGPLSHSYDLNFKKYTKNTQTVHKKQIHKLRNILFNSQTKKHTKIGILISMGRLINLTVNLQFQIPSLLHSVLKFTISDFAFLRMYTLLICWEKLFNFLNSRGPLGVRGPQVKNHLSRSFRLKATWTWLDEECTNKQSKFQWLQNPSQINANNRKCEILWEDYNEWW
jgi:hypothetical protein